MRKVVMESASLATPRGRLIFVTLASCIVLVVPFHWLGSLSLWGRLGLDWMPSIGLTRAYWLLVHGRPAEAVAFNWLIVPVVVVAGTLVIRDLRHLWTGTKTVRYT
jgi:hypothetical protein